MQKLFGSPKTMVITLVIGVALASATFVRAQSATSENRIIVDLPYTVLVGDQVLQPGHYVMREIHQYVIQITNESDPNSPEVEATYTTISADANKTPGKTRVVLGKLDNDYYMDRMWIQGNDTGYEFTLPERIKSRIKERGMEPSIEATMQPDAGR